MSPTINASLSEWQTYIESIHSSAIDLGLERVALISKKAKLTKPAKKIITVAGTNGKGSTCAILEAVLLEAGYTTGVYSSPHLIRYNERVRINGHELADDMHVKAFAFIESIRDDVSLSFFEYATLAALFLFDQHELDVLILEVGLGGRLDATNVVEHDVSVITSLAIDHVDWLGDDLSVIGLEKAGIFREGKPAVCGQPFPPATVAAYADEIKAKLSQIGYQYSYEVHDNHWVWKSGSYLLDSLPIPTLPIQNAATAIMALGVAKLPDVAEEHIIRGLKNVRLAGRMERISSSPLVIMDVAHNPHSAQYLAEQLKSLRQSRTGQIHAVVGMLSDKDIKSTLDAVKEQIDHWYPSTLSVPRGAAWQVLTAHLPDVHHGFDHPLDAYETAKSQLDDISDVLVIFGSFHTVGAISEHISKME